MGDTSHHPLQRRNVSDRVPAAFLQGQGSAHPLRRFDDRRASTVQLSAMRDMIQGGQVIQAYQVKRAPEDRKIYSQSENGNMVTGMDTPNHTFYVAHSAAFPAMNSFIQNSPYELVPDPSKTLFHQKMHGVRLQYRSKRLKDEGRKEKIKRKEVKKEFIESSEKMDLHKEYERRILPNLKLYREATRDSAYDALRSTGLRHSETVALSAHLKALMGSVNLFKKVLNAELANRGAFDTETDLMAKVGYGLVETVEHPLYKKKLRVGHLEAAKQTLLETWFDEMDRDNPNIVNQILFEILDHLQALIDVLPRDLPINMLLLQKYNFNNDILEKLYGQDNLVVYRACDVMSSTLLGNKLTPENAQQLKSYSAQVDSQYHFVTKILGSGTDWVTLESFAGTPLERMVSGTEGVMVKNIDHTWQFIMQGSQATTEEDAPGVDKEDKYFETYTKIRYMLKGYLNQPKGGLDNMRRDRVKLEQESQRFVQYGGIGFLANVVGWLAYEGGVSDSQKENELRDLIGKMDLYVYQGMDPLVHSKLIWDKVMEGTLGK